MGHGYFSLKGVTRIDGYVVWHAAHDLVAARRITSADFSHYLNLLTAP